MSKKEILAFKTNMVASPKTEMDLQLERWSPSIKSLVPPGKSYRYFLFTLFHFFGIFKGKHYSCYRYFHESQLASSFLVVPSFFKWKFMEKGAVQFTYVMTSKNYRGKGLAWQGIYKACKKLREDGIDQFWYITDSENIASQNLAKKMGFTFVGKLNSTKKFFGLIRILEFNEDK